MAGWDDFPDANDDDPWSAFPDATPSAKPVASPPRPQTQARGLQSGAPVQQPRAVDGDTIAAGDQRVRLYGVDAPEMRQQGWNSVGLPVAIGQDSQRFLQGAITNTNSAHLGDIAGASWGRPVAPITLGEKDAGQSIIRSGTGLAAPDYLSSDPARQFDYMEAERLARLNRLGQHDTLAQNPAAHRANPGYVPDRQTVAQFFDTPTPYAGMRPDAEAEYVDLLKAGSAQDIYKFGTSQGLGMDLDEVTEWVSARDKAASSGRLLPTYANYQRGPRILQDNGDGAAGAGTRAFAQGFVASGLDEAGAVADMLGGTEGRENIWNSDRRWADIWANNQWQNSSILGFDQAAHPGLTTGAQVAGALTSGFVLPYGQGARTVPQLARVGAVYGGAEGALGTDGPWYERAKGGLIGAPLGAAVNAVGGKVLEAAAPFVVRGANKVADRFGMRRAVEQPFPNEPFGPPAPSSRALADEWDAFPDAEPLMSVKDGVRAGDEWDEFPDAETVGMDADPLPSVSANPRQPDYLDMGAVRPGRLLDGPTPAQVRAASERILPRDVLPIPSNTLDGIGDVIAKDAGRIVEARVPNERTTLERRTVRGWNGSDIPKVGPVDLVGWTRLNGGLNDAGDAVSRGGDLRAMGMNNAARKGMEFVGQEARFGPLVNNEGGMSLDDAAHAAWEAGYFPERTERPSVNQFLDALGDAREAARGQIGNTAYRLPPKGRTGAAMPVADDAWSDFPDADGDDPSERSPWDDFPDAEQ